MILKLLAYKEVALSLKYGHPQLQHKGRNLPFILLNRDRRHSSGDYDCGAGYRGTMLRHGNVEGDLEWSLVGIGPR